MQQFSLDMEACAASCRVVIGRDLFGQLAEELRQAHPALRLALLGDSRVMPLWGGLLMKALQAEGLHVLPFIFPEGEAFKTREMKAELEDRMLEAGFGRDSLLIALGGGVSLDLGGYLAATYLRGIPYVSVPTDTLAMTDASIGGKCGVDTPAGKNLIGAFKLPEAVYMDMDTLTTLDERSYRAGLAEALKLGFAADEMLLELMEEGSEALLARDPKTLEAVIARCARVKSDIVQKDFTEAGLRRILNYGHTAGHAYELCSGYQLLHGEAVAFGIRAAARKALELGICDAGWTARQERALDRLGFSDRLPDCPADLFAAALQQDKKKKAGKNVWVLTKGPADAVFYQDL